MFPVGSPCLGRIPSPDSSKEKPELAAPLLYSSEMASASRAGGLIWAALRNGMGTHRPPYLDTSLIFGRTVLDGRESAEAAGAVMAV